MNTISLDDLINLFSSYNPNIDDLTKIVKAYEYASIYHAGQYRESGEEYITHPLNVAYILAQMQADTNTVCAGLLHDVLEDTKSTKEEIEHEFGSEVAHLVDGVTNIKDLSFTTEEMKYYNTRKIITSITDDVRIIIIKLADRLHNMRTLNYKRTGKQQEKALETLEIYAPFAYYIGAYRWKIELEDLSFKYLKPDEFNAMSYKRSCFERENTPIVEEMLYKIKRILDDKKIPNDLRIRIKNVYGIYQKLQEGKKLNDIHDLIALKVIVDDIDNCYVSLGVVHSLYRPLHYKIRDYICCPKTNGYMSLHSTVYGPNGFVHTQVRTEEMDKISAFGLPAYWDLNRGNARTEMQKNLREKCQFYSSLVEIDSMFDDNKEFCESIKNEVFSDKDYIYTISGEVVELPKGSTIIDFAYKLNPALANSMTGAMVNDEVVPLNYVLQTKDRVKIITNDLNMGPQENWENIAQTSLAKKLILSAKKNN